MATYYLVHGAGHGNWVWEALAVELASRGHRSVAVDLPIEDDQAGLREYADAVIASLGSENEGRVLVGHSMGGLVLPVVASQVTFDRIVFLCASIPVIGKSAIEAAADHKPTGARTVDDLYDPDCPEVLKEWAKARLRRQSRKPYEDVPPIAALPQTPTVYILARQDQCLPAPLLRRLAAERLGVKPIEIDGGHSPMLARPGELAELLVMQGELGG